jgi:hypothetical protein
MTIKTAAGTTLSIGTTATDPTSDTYAVIGELNAIPEMGDIYDDVQFENLGTATYEHNTGAKNASSMSIGIGRNLSDAGQVAVLTAKGVNSYYNFKIIYSDSTFDYFKAKVQGLTTTPGAINGNIMATIKLQPQPGSYVLGTS